MDRLEQVRHVRPADLQRGAAQFDEFAGDLVAERLLVGVPHQVDLRLDGLQDDLLEPFAHGFIDTGEHRGAFPLVVPGEVVAPDEIVDGGRCPAHSAGDFVRSEPAKGQPDDVSEDIGVGDEGISVRAGLRGDHFGERDVIGEGEGGLDGLRQPISDRKSIPAEVRLDRNARDSAAVLRGPPPPPFSDEHDINIRAPTDGVNLARAHNWRWHAPHIPARLRNSLILRDLVGFARNSIFPARRMGVLTGADERVKGGPRGRAGAADLGTGLRLGNRAEMPMPIRRGV